MDHLTLLDAHWSLYHGYRLGNGKPVEDLKGLQTYLGSTKTTDMTLNNKHKGYTRINRQALHALQESEGAQLQEPVYH